MRKITYILIIFLISKTIWSQSINDETWNHHVHIFSPLLLDNLRINTESSRLIQGANELYTNIDTIMNKAISDRIVLISAGYGYSKELKTEEQLARLLSAENDYLFEAYNLYKERIFPFVGIDPSESYSLEELKRCYFLFDKFGIKLHFHSSKIELLNFVEIERIKPIFQFASSNRIPLLIHFKNHNKNFGKEDVEAFFKNLTNKKNKLTIIFAHTSGDGIINEKTREIATEILKINEEYQQNIYFDISAAIWDKYLNNYELSDKDKRELLNEIGFEKIIYGSDYPATEFESFRQRLKYRLNLTDEEFIQITTNSPLKEYAR